MASTIAWRFVPVPESSTPIVIVIASVPAYPILERRFRRYGHDVAHRDRRLAELLERTNRAFSGRKRGNEDKTDTGVEGVPHFGLRDGSALLHEVEDRR